MPQSYKTVSGGNCTLSLWRESSPGVIDSSVPGVLLDFYTENFSAPANKSATSIINGKRGQGKPVPGIPDYTGTVELAPYAPIMGHILRALCGAPTTTAVDGIALSGTVVNEGGGCVGLPLDADVTQLFVQDDAVTITGSANYNGVYRCEYGTGSGKIVIKHAYTAESLSAVTASRGCGGFLKGAAVDKTGGKVGLPLDGLGATLHVGESVTIDGTTAYDGTYVLQTGTTRKLLVVTATYTAETLDGTPTALPSFYKHRFVLPKTQPTCCIQKYLDYEAGAAENPYRVFYSNKINGLSFNSGGQTEVKISLEFSVGSEEPSASPVSATAPQSLPEVLFLDQDIAAWLDDERLCDVETANISTSYGIEAKSALGDRHKRSRQPEGDPSCSCSCSVFVEQDRYSLLSDRAATIKFSLSMSGANGEQFWVVYPEAELDTSGVSIAGKGGLSQDVKVTAFVDDGAHAVEYVLVNRVASYA